MQFSQALRKVLSFSTSSEHLMRHNFLLTILQETVTAKSTHKQRCVLTRNTLYFVSTEMTASVSLKPLRVTTQ